MSPPVRLAISRAVSALGGHDVDLLLIGAGPVGLYGAYYAGARGLSVAVVDLSQLAAR